MHMHQLRMHRQATCGTRRACVPGNLSLDTRTPYEHPSVFTTLHTYSRMHRYLYMQDYTQTYIQKDECLDSSTYGSNALLDPNLKFECNQKNTGAFRAVKEPVALRYFMDTKAQQLDSDQEPELTKLAELQVHEQVRKAAFAKCDDQVRAYVACSRERTVSVVWACRTLLKSLNECVQQYTGAEQYRLQRIEYAKAHPNAVKSWNRSSKVETP